MDIKKINIPLNPGVYLMKDIEGKIIYIGKAKNLKNRVSSYFVGAHNIKTMELVKNIESIDFFICTSEVEAFILENNLIKKHKPKYNILLKDQKTYPYIKITKEEYPRIMVVRRVTDDAYYFGPFPNVNMKEVVNNIMKVFKIRDCKIDMRKNTKVCLKYYMKLCNGPCYYKLPEIKEEYLENVKHLLDFLENKDVEVLKYLEKRMETFSQNLEYERAIIERERIKSLKKLLSYQITETNTKNDEDIFSIKKNKDDIFICVLSIRAGKLIAKDSKRIDNMIDNDIIDSIIPQYYDKKLLPSKIVLSSNFEDKKEVLSAWFKEEKKKNVKIVFPKRGRLAKLLNLAEVNLINEQERYYNEKQNLTKDLEELKKLLNLDKYPRFIECYDMSNIQGSDNVGVGVAFINGKRATKLYRKYKIKTVVGANDYDSMKEVILRRMEHNPYPDLILLDGGKAHVSVIKRALKENDIDLPVFGMYKDDHHKTYGICDEKKVFDLQSKEELFKLITRFQDEVHRFAINYHKVLREKRVLHSKLDEIKGIGKKRKKELLEKFGTVKAVLEADLEELEKILPKNIAKEINKIND